MSLVGFKGKNHRQQVGKRGACDKTDDRSTPAEIFDHLNEEFKFTLDVAASPDNAKCSDYFTIKEDGLAAVWSGSVWCNPPYSNLYGWVSKAFSEVMAGCHRVVMLLPANRCEQLWWQDFIEPMRDGRGMLGIRVQTRFLSGRPRFGWPEGHAPKSPKGDRPPFGLVVVIIERVKRDT